MTRLRVPALPALLLALCGFATLGAEAGHSRAHRDGHGSSGHHHEESSSGALVTRATLAPGHATADHLHPDLRATIPLRTLAPAPAIIQMLKPPEWRIAAVQRITLLISHGLAPPEHAQAPPPPSRSPPQA